MRTYTIMWTEDDKRHTIVLTEPDDETAMSLYRALVGANMYQVILTRNEGMQEMWNGQTWQ